MLNSVSRKLNVVLQFCLVGWRVGWVGGLCRLLWFARSLKVKKCNPHDMIADGRSSFLNSLNHEVFIVMSCDLQNVV